MLLKVVVVVGPRALSALPSKSLLLLCRCGSGSHTAQFVPCITNSHQPLATLSIHTRDVHSRTEEPPMSGRAECGDDRVYI